jgi:hypothetical protein
MATAAFVEVRRDAPDALICQPGDPGDDPVAHMHRSHTMGRWGTFFRESFLTGARHEKAAVAAAGVACAQSLDDDLLSADTTI